MNHFKKVHHQSQIEWLPQPTLTSLGVSIQSMRMRIYSMKDLEPADWRASSTRETAANMRKCVIIHRKENQISIEEREA